MLLYFLPFFESLQSHRSFLFSLELLFSVWCGSVAARSGRVPYVIH